MHENSTPEKPITYRYTSNMRNHRLRRYRKMPAVDSIRQAYKNDEQTRALLRAVADGTRDDFREVAELLQTPTGRLYVLGAPRLPLLD